MKNRVTSHKIRTAEIHGSHCKSVVLYALAGNETFHWMDILRIFLLYVYG